MQPLTHPTCLMIFARNRHNSRNQNRHQQVQRAAALLSLHAAKVLDKCLISVFVWTVQAKMERADALAEERAALTNYMRNTLITNELKFKEVRSPTCLLIKAASPC